MSWTLPVGLRADRGALQRRGRLVRPNLLRFYDLSVHCEGHVEEIGKGSLGKCSLARALRSSHSPLQAGFPSLGMGRLYFPPYTIDSRAGHLVGASLQVRNGCPNAVLSISPHGLEGPPCLGANIFINPGHQTTV